MKQLLIEIIDECPNHCLYCSSMASMPGFCYLGLSDIQRVVYEAKELGFDTICISGGEPFQHARLYDIVRTIKSLGLTVYIYTSGIIQLHTETDCGITSLDYDLLCDMKDIGVDKFIFDLPAITKEVYEDLMGITGYQRYVFQSIKDVKDLGFCVELHFVVTKKNINEIDKVVDFVLKNDLDKVSFLRLVLQGRAFIYSNCLSISDEELQSVKLKLKNLNNKYGDKIRIGSPLQDIKCGVCNAIIDKLCICANGSVIGCETFKNLRYIIDGYGEKVLPDTIYNNTLKEILQYSYYLKLSKDILKSCKSDCDVCPMQNYRENEGTDNLFGV